MKSHSEYPKFLDTRCSTICTHLYLLGVVVVFVLLQVGSKLRLTRWNKPLGVTWWSYSWVSVWDLLGVFSLDFLVCCPQTIFPQQHLCGNFVKFWERNSMLQCYMYFEALSSKKNYAFLSYVAYAMIIIVILWVLSA